MGSGTLFPDRKIMPFSGRIFFITAESAEIAEKKFYNKSAEIAEKKFYNKKQKTSLRSLRSLR
jgi:hypothetical protein